MVLGAFSRKLCADSESGASVERKQREDLLRLLTHAEKNVPRFKGVGSGELSLQNVFDRLKQYPVMRRADIQPNPKAFMAAGCSDIRRDATGGSTGTPMTFFVDRGTQVARESSLWWANALAGWQPGEKVAMLWGSDRDCRGAVAHARLKLRWWIENMRWYNAFEMGEGQMSAFHKALCRFRPHLLVAYAGAVFTFARYLQSSGIKPSYPLRAIVSSAEMITADMKGLVETVFGRPVYDRYGNREFGAIAAECGAHDGLHVNSSDLVIEIDSPDAGRIPGPILITYLKNYTMPFIRYDTGDLGLLSMERTCPCGRESPRLKQIVGRRSDMIRTGTGALVHGEFFTHMFYGSNIVRQFQFVQEGLEEYSLYLVADKVRAVSEEGRWRREIQAVTGADSRLTITYTERIPSLPSGKHRFTISKLS